MDWPNLSVPAHSTLNCSSPSRHHILAYNSNRGTFLTRSHAFLTRIPGRLYFHGSPKHSQCPNTLTPIPPWPPSPCPNSNSGSGPLFDHRPCQAPKLQVGCLSADTPHSLHYSHHSPTHTFPCCLVSTPSAGRDNLLASHAGQKTRNEAETKEIKHLPNQDKVRNWDLGL